MSIKRRLYRDLWEHLSKRELSLIVGPRQAGKTTLMLQIREDLEKQGEKTLYLSLDFERDQPHFLSQAALLDRIRLEFGSRRGYVFIDEIQRKVNAGLFLKGLFDMGTPYKFVVSGSGSVELKEKVHESLAGRKRIFELDTVSLAEFVDFRTAYRYEGRLDRYFQVTGAEGRSLLMEYLNFGGYPRVVLEETLNEKLHIINDIYRSYIEKDISFLLRVERIDAFGSLIRLLAGQSGNMLNIHEISSTLGISAQTVKNYLSYAEKTYVITRIAPYFRNLRKEISKSPMVYFHDLGLRNFSINHFGRHAVLHEMGFLFQSLLYNLLRERTRRDVGTIHFWRTKDGSEVDFIIDKGESVIPVEVKCREIVKKEIGRSLRGFIARYEPVEAWVVNLSLKADEKIDKTLVRFIPFYELL